MVRFQLPQPFGGGFQIKRIVSFFLCFCLIIFFVPFVFADDNNTDQQFFAYCRTFNENLDALTSVYYPASDGNIVQSYGRIDWMGYQILCSPGNKDRIVTFSADVGFAKFDNLANNYLSISLATSNASKSTVAYDCKYWVRRVGGDTILMRPGVYNHAYFTHIYGYAVIHDEAETVVQQSFSTNFQFTIRESSSSYVNQPIALRIRNVQVHTMDFKFEFFSDFFTEALSQWADMYTALGAIQTSVEDLNTDFNSRMSTVIYDYLYYIKDYASLFRDVGFWSRPATYNPSTGKFEIASQPQSTFWYKAIYDNLHNMSLYYDLLIERHNYEIDSGISDAYSNLSHGLAPGLSAIVDAGGIDDVADFNDLVFGTVTGGLFAWFSSECKNSIESSRRGPHDNDDIYDFYSENQQAIADILGGVDSG